MVKYAGPDDVAESDNTTSAEGQRFSIVGMARLLKVSTIPIVAASTPPI